MKNKIGICLLGFCCTAFPAVELRNGYTFGPVFNRNFGAKGRFRSIGFNVYYWEFRDKAPWSVGIGFEHGLDGQNLLFSEIQTGWVLTGTSLGIVFSDRKGFGFQGSIWGNFLAGASIRYRYLDGSMFSPGLYLSIPYMESAGNFE